MLFSIVVAVLGGCGGSGGTPAFSDFAGLFTSDYSRTHIEGVVTVTVEPNGQVHVGIDDDTEGTFSGSSTLDEDGGFVVEATQVSSNDTVSITGTVTESATGNSRSVSLSVSGDFVASSVSLTYKAASFGDAIAGSYSGSYDGGAVGTWTASVTSKGVFTGTATETSTGDEVSLTGTISKTGIGALAGGTGTGSEEEYIVTWGGLFFVSSGGAVDGEGVWSDNESDSGTWSGSKN